MNLDHTLQAMGFITAATIFWRAELVLNLMSKDCLLAIRLAFWMLVVGAISFNLEIIQGYVPPLVVILPLAGVALLLLVERRIGAILRIHTPVSNERRTRQ
ncbi:MAG TPA: hypothetical protein VM783_14105 [Candidatus Acidoferrum sp.]|nr:hypothetical protein [Candidatus Acidoferrum sp.]